MDRGAAGLQGCERLVVVGRRLARLHARVELPSASDDRAATSATDWTRPGAADSPGGGTAPRGGATTWPRCGGAAAGPVASTWARLLRGVRAGRRGRGRGTRRESPRSHLRRAAACGPPPPRSQRCESSASVGLIPAATASLRRRRRSISSPSRFALHERVAHLLVVEAVAVRSPVPRLSASPIAGGPEDTSCLAPIAAASPVDEGALQRQPGSAERLDDAREVLRHGDRLSDAGAGVRRCVTQLRGACGALLRRCRGAFARRQRRVRAGAQGGLGSLARVRPRGALI